MIRDTFRQRYIHTSVFLSVEDMANWFGLRNFAGNLEGFIHIYIYTYSTYIHSCTVEARVLFTNPPYPTRTIYFCTYCTQPIKVFNPNRTSTLLELHSLKYTYIHINRGTMLLCAILFKSHIYVIDHSIRAWSSLHGFESAIRLVPTLLG